MITGTLSAICLILIFTIKHEKKAEPHYNGQSVSYWLDHLHNHGYYRLPDFVNQEAVDSLKAMGRDAVPYMVSVLKERTYYEKNSVLRFFSNLYQKPYMKPIRSLLPSNKLRPSDEYELTLKILGEMGSEAHSAIPFLIEEIKQPQHFHMGKRGDVAVVLTKILPGSGYEKEAIAAINVSKKLPFLTQNVAMGLNQGAQSIQELEIVSSLEDENPAENQQINNP